MLPEDLKELRRMWTGYMPARVIITANSLGVFDRLTRAASSDEVAGAIGADRRATFLLLNALTALGLLKKTGKGYRNTPLADRYLVKGKPHYQGDIIRHNAMMWQNWSALDEVMMAGRPARKAREHESFILGMHNLSVFRAREVVRKIGLKGVKKALDLGGGPGTYAIELARRGVDVTLIDLPETMSIARKVARKEGVKVRLRAGDFILDDDIGKGYDLILVSQILHAYSEPHNIAVLEKCASALNPGGRVAIQEFPINEELTGPPPGALFAINMLVGTDAGRCYSTGEMKRWLRGAGFGKIAVRHTEDTVLVMGTLRG